VSGARAVFVDRDGTINELVPDPRTGRPESPLRPEDVRLLDGAPAALSGLAAAGWLLVGVSNQPAAAKQTVTVEQLDAVQHRVLELLAGKGVHFDDFRLCLHHPDGSDPELGRECSCRKPHPGMLLDSAEQLGIDLSRSWMVGDTSSDVMAGHAAGCRTVLLTHAPSAHKRVPSSEPDLSAADLPAASALLLAPGALD
jgi:D-glycero-D-manno-heptose 1,7-bisphosphate phosphatase